MPTECMTESLTFQGVAGREVVARFDGGTLTSDGGAVLLRAVATNLLGQFAARFTDHRAPARVTHPVAALVRQRAYGLALGYEDLTYHDPLRHDPLIAVLAEWTDLTAPWAGKSTLNRLAARRGDPALALHHASQHNRPPNSYPCGLASSSNSTETRRTLRGHGAPPGQSDNYPDTGGNCTSTNASMSYRSRPKRYRSTASTFPLIPTPGGFVLKRRHCPVSAPARSSTPERPTAYRRDNSRSTPTPIRMVEAPQLR